MREANPDAIVIEAASPISVDHPDRIRGKSVLVVVDGPTLTHGGMTYGAGVIAAEKFGAEDIIDPRETRLWLCNHIEAAQNYLRTELGPKAKYGTRP